MRSGPKGTQAIRDIPSGSHGIRHPRLMHKNGVRALGYPLESHTYDHCCGTGLRQRGGTAPHEPGRSEIFTMRPGRSCHVLMGECDAGSAHQPWKTANAYLDNPRAYRAITHRGRDYVWARNVPAASSSAFQTNSPGGPKSPRIHRPREVRGSEYSAADRQACRPGRLCCLG
jgi:hypothetical protein